MSAELTHLLRQIRRAGSPLARLRVAGRAWKQIRRMSAGQRAELVKGLGIEGAEGLVERIASRSGKMSPAVLLRALEFAKENDEESIREVLRNLGSKDGRKQLLERGLERLAEEPEAAPRWVARPPEVRPTSEQPAKTAAKAAAAAGTAAVAHRKGRGKSPEPQARPETKPAPQPKPEPKPQRAPKPQPNAANTPSTPRPTAPEPKVSAPPAPAPKPRSKTPAGLDTRRVRDRMLEEERPGARLRELRTSLDRMSGLSAAQAAELLAALDADWMRRRALDAMIRGNRFRSVTEAMASIEELEQPASRRWCIGSLLAHGAPSDAQRDELLAWRKTGSREFSVATAL